MIAAIRDKDPIAFTQLVAELDRDLTKLAYIITGSRELAEDAAQATWERLWRQPPELRDATKLRPWLRTVCANGARQAARRHRRQTQLQTDPNSRGSDVEDLASDLADLKLALARLPAPDRELLALRFALDLPSHQIAEQLGLSAEGARTRLHRILKRLREELDNV
jgi:RNA polymerase sigma-70 factor (ECF subfamily)